MISLRSTIRSLRNMERIELTHILALFVKPAKTGVECAISHYLIQSVINFIKQ